MGVPQERTAGQGFVPGGLGHRLGTLHVRGFFSELGSKCCHGAVGSWWRQDFQGQAGGRRAASQGRSDGQGVKHGEDSEDRKAPRRTEILRDRGGSDRVRVKERSEVKLEGY